MVCTYNSLLDSTPNTPNTQDANESPESLPFDWPLHAYFGEGRHGSVWDNKEGS